MTSKKNSKKLAIVESPKKASTIGGFLGKEWDVTSSYGHIKDLPKSKLGVDTDNNFEPTFEVPPKAKKQVSTLKKKLKEADSVWLATDEDREGEAIAQHILEALGLEKADKPVKRVVFHEITKSAIQEAIENPREVDENLVDAQKARRVLDRLVGYKLSPLIWKKIAYGLSAGRVQSVALRLVAEREQEIQKFKPEEYWSITANFQPEGKADDQFEAKLHAIDKKKLEKFDIAEEKRATQIKEEAEGKNYQVADYQVNKKNRNPFPPFTTASLQQEAGIRLGFSSSRTMKVAQQLYEGKKLGKEGSTGLITYHRTDSVRLSPKAIAQAKEIVPDQFGKKYLKTRQYTSKGRTQEAHEAIRPTEMWRKPEDIKKHLTSDQYKLYDLIYRRSLASQMSPAVFEQRRIDIIDQDNKFTFRATGQVKTFDGYTAVYSVKSQETELPEMNEGDPAELLKITPTQHFTEPPPRYSEATLIKELKENGVGRPSTYAPTMQVIQRRGYVEPRDGRLYLTDTGKAVNDLLVQHFPDIVDIDFTAHMEEDLDKIAAGKKNWQPVIKEFYEPFEKNLEKKQEEISKEDFGQEKTDRTCPDCGSPLVKKIGRYGAFYSCSDYPNCKYSEPILDKVGVDCPECGKGEIVRRRSKKGRTFYGCSAYPDCKNAYFNEPIGEKCPNCGSMLVQKSKKKIACSNQECDYQKAVKEKE